MLFRWTIGRVPTIRSVRVFAHEIVTFVPEAVFDDADPSIIVVERGRYRCRGRSDRSPEDLAMRQVVLSWRDRSSGSINRSSCPAIGKYWQSISLFEIFHDRVPCLFGNDSSSPVVQIQRLLRGHRKPRGRSAPRENRSRRAGSLRSIPEMLVAMQTSPADIASVKETLNPSRSLGRTNRSLA